MGRLRGAPGSFFSLRSGFFQLEIRDRHDGSPPLFSCPGISSSQVVSPDICRLGIAGSGTSIFQATSPGISCPGLDRRPDSFSPSPRERWLGDRKGRKDASTTSGGQRQPTDPLAGHGAIGPSGFIGFTGRG